MLEDDEVRDEVQEILGKIEGEHEKGGHITGPVAGCSICARQRTQREAEAMSVEDLARLRIVQTPVPVPTITFTERDELGPDSGEARGLTAIIGDAGKLHALKPREEETLGDLALQDAQQALDDLSELAQRGIVVPNAEQAIAHALVGVVRALAGIEGALRDVAARYSGTEPSPPAA